MSNHSPRTETVYIGLGSNLADPVRQLQQARQTISALHGIEETGYSSLYSSPPMGPQDQPDYLNSVMRVNCSMSAYQLLRQLQDIEIQQGRIKTRHWGERTVDLDILLFGQQQINQPDLIIPHAGLTERAFVVYPLHEISGDELIIPGHDTLGKLIVDFPLNGLNKLEEPQNE